MVDLQEIEAIKRLKYKYVRCLDLKRWKEMEECFAEDATSAYGDGKYSYDGRDQILGFLRQALGHNMISMHQVHHPEIELTSPTTATGIWALQDMVIETNANITIRGTAFYHDEYVKLGGQWKIKHIGYERVFEETLARSDISSLRLTENRWASD